MKKYIYKTKTCNKLAINGKDKILTGSFIWFLIKSRIVIFNFLPKL